MSAAPSAIYQCEGATTARELSRNDLPLALRREIRRLQRIEPRRAGRALEFAGLWIGAGSVAHWSSSFVVDGVCLIVMAAAMMGLSVMMHEGSHHLLFRSRALSRLAGFCCGLPVLISASAYRVLHLKHHALERSERDPDDIERLARPGLPLVLVYYLLILLGTYLYLGHVALQGLRLTRGRDRTIVQVEYLVIGTVVGIAWWLAPRIMIEAWLLPLLLAAQLTNLRSIAEHGLTTGGNSFVASRSVRSNAVVRYFLCNLNFHLEHHLFPAVPWYNLPRLHEVLRPALHAAGSSVYRSYGEFLRDFVRTTWSGVVPNVRLLPAHLRDELCL